jgi:alpha-L-rhamnosidase
MLRAIRLRCEYQENSLGIGEPRPRFGWVLDADASDVIQKSYHIHVGVHRDFRSILWDGEKAETSDSIQVEYAGPALDSTTRYYWRVKITDNHGQVSDWSETAQFETSILDPSQWKGDFISPQDEDPASSKGMLLRKEFTLQGEASEARIYATSLGLYELSLNGARVGDAVFTPGWTAYGKRLQFQAYNVTDMLRFGANAIGVRLGCGWYKGDLVGWLGGRNLYGNRTALLFQMDVRFSDGREQRVVSDTSWMTSDGPIIFSELYHGEIYDARREQPGWDRPGFDDAGWRPARRLDQHRGILIAQEGPLVKRQETLRAISLFTTPKGERVLDFGQNMAGWVRFTVRGKAGQRVVLRHAEVLDAAGNFYTANLRSAKARVEYVLAGAESETFEPHFTFQGFRYVMIEEFPRTPSIDDFSAVVLHSAMERTGTFECSHPLLNALHRNILWSLKGNCIDVPTDCPQRDERLGWTGDAQVFIRTACFHMDTVLFYTKWLRDLSADQRADGGVPFVVPDVLSVPAVKDPMMRQSHSSCGWGDAAVICPWTLYQCYGDRRILERQYESMKAWVEYIRSRAQDGVLWNSGFHFGDWVALDAKEGSYFGATPNDLTATAFYAHSTELLARSAAVLARHDDEREYRQLHERIVKAFRDEFFTPSGRLAARTQTAHILTLSFGLAPEEHRGRCMETLISLLNENGGHLTTGFLGTPYFCRVLSDGGRLEAAYALLLRQDFPSWLYPITKGATTIWEHWDGIKPDGTMWSENMNSFNHYAYGAVGDWLYRVVAGLDTDPESVGYGKILLKPRPGGGLTWARAEYMTPYGLTSLAWTRGPATMRVDVLVPHNATARLILPGASPESIEGDTVRFASCEGGAEAVIGSGQRTFTYPQDPPLNSSPGS